MLVTCFRWSPSLSNPYHFAAGVSTGQVVISSFQPIPGSVPAPPEAAPVASKPTVPPYALAMGRVVLIFRIVL